MIMLINMKTAMYAFSGDPITYGHIDIIKRASSVFDKLIVAIGVNTEKSYTFSLEERTDMAKHTLSTLSNVEVTSFQGLLVDFAYEKGASIIVKGVRNTSDFNYETILHLMGESQKLGIDTHILIARPELTHVSSSMVKAMHKEHGLIHQLVPLYVKQMMETKLSRQYMVSVTGEIGTGKSYVCHQFEEWGKKNKIPVHHIELDFLGHEITNELTDPRYVIIRQQIAERFGKEVLLKDGFINRKALGEIVFNDPKALAALNEIMTQPLSVRIRRAVYGKEGLVLINAALIAEAGMSYLSNNHVVLVEADSEIQEKRLKNRTLSEEQIQRRLASQFNTEEKASIIYDEISKHSQGHLWRWKSQKGTEGLESLFSDIVKTLGIQ